MTRVVAVVGLLVLVLGLTVMARAVAADDPKVPTSKEIMTKLNKGPDCLKAVLAKQLKADTQDWTLIQKESREFAEATAALGKNTPKKGDKDSWDKLTKAYATDAKALATAAEKKDSTTARPPRPSSTSRAWPATWPTAGVPRARRRSR